MTPRTRSLKRTLESLPAELFLCIAEYADWDARLALSATNSSYRSLLLPIIFRTLKITNDEEVANEILALVDRIGGGVRALSFHGTGEPNPDDQLPLEANASEEERANRAYREKLRHRKQLLSPAVAELLRGEHFPNMTTMIVHFDFDFNRRDGIWDSRDTLSMGASMYVMTVQETSKEMVDESEAEFPWRRVMAQTWAAVSENRNVKQLVINNLITKAISPWFSPQWQRFLSQILVADISIWGSDNCAGWEVGTLEGYMYFLSKMDTYFFNHMKNTTKLRLKSYEHGPLGSHWTDVKRTMSLRPDCFPQLKELHLEFAVICPELVAFLRPKAKTLKSLTLHECFASNEYPSIRLTWADFFSALRKFNPKWESFDITNNAPPPLTFKEWQANKYGREHAIQPHESDEETDETRRIRAELASDPSRRLFLYATLTSKYGDRWPDENNVIDQYDAGHDLQEFKMLDDVLRSNNRH